MQHRGLALLSTARGCFLSPLPLTAGDSSSEQLLRGEPGSRGALGLVRSQAPGVDPGKVAADLASALAGGGCGGDAQRPSPAAALISELEESGKSRSGNGPRRLLPSMLVHASVRRSVPSIHRSIHRITGYPLAFPNDDHVVTTNRHVKACIMHHSTYVMPTHP